MKIEKFALHIVSQSEIAEVLQNGLAKNFKHVSVEVMDCPNMKEKPFVLSAEGICEHPCLADVGGVEYLLPLVQRDKVYDFKTIVKNMDRQDVLIIGAGAGPWPHVGVSCEMMANVKLGEKDIINTQIAKITEGKCELVHLKDNTQFAVMGNLYVSDGKPGKVVRIIAKERIGDDNFITSMRKILDDHYQEKIVGMGGVFIMKKGKAKLHVMSDFSEKPLKTIKETHSWLNFFEMSAPLTCLSTFVSHDPGLNLNIEHTHCFSDHNEGGHYHCDTTPDIVEYEGYFNIAQDLYRIDQPSTKHEFEEN